MGRKRIGTIQAILYSALMSELMMYSTNMTSSAIVMPVKMAECMVELRKSTKNTRMPISASKIRLNIKNLLKMSLKNFRMVHP